MKNLISMTDFVLQDKSMSSSNIINYANFLKQPLELWMFVPCDDNGNVLEEPYNYQEFINGNNLNTLCEEYKEAKERCLFEGFYSENGIVFTPEKQILIQQSLLNKMTIENLVDIKYKLTQTAIKQLAV